MNQVSTPPGCPMPAPGPGRAPILQWAAERAIVGLARLLIHVFFREVEVEHGDRVCSGRPTVMVVNHRNGLVDGLVLMAALPRTPRFLGKSTLFHNPLLWPFLKLAGVVPVYRAQDGVSTDRNSGAFSDSNRLLAHGGLVGIFPEGISHDRPALQPLRTGAARIALGAADATGAEVETVAVALLYDDKRRFRSRALVRVGVPRSTDPWMEDYQCDGNRAVRLLTDDLADRLRALGPDHVSWSEAAGLATIAEIVARKETDPLDHVDLVERERVATELAQAEAQTSPESLVAVGSMHAAEDRYRRALLIFGLNDAQVAAGHHLRRLGGGFSVAVAKVTCAIPLAAAGVVIHFVPYQVVKRVSRLPDNESMRATVKLLGCFFLFTATYVVLGVWMGDAFGAWWGLVAAACAPACGYLAVRTAELIRRIRQALEGRRVALDQGPYLASLRADRSEVVDAARAVIHLSTTTPDGHVAPDQVRIPPPSGP